MGKVEVERIVSVIVPVTGRMINYLFHCHDRKVTENRYDSSQGIPILEEHDANRDNILTLKNEDDIMQKPSASEISRVSKLQKLFSLPFLH